MDITFEEEQLMLKSAARDFFGKECPSSLVRQMEEDSGGYPPEIWRKMADLGWLGLLLPEKYGGQGGSFVNMGLILEELGYSGLNTPWLSTIGIGALLVAQLGTESQKRKLLPGIAKGNITLSLALLEPGGDWLHAEEITTRAVRAKGGYVLSGTKLFAPYAHIADYIICVARTRKGNKAEDGITLFLVEGKAPGVNTTVLDTVAHDKQCEAIFEGVKVAAENVLGELHKGWEPLRQAVDRVTPLKCAEMLGSAKRAWDIATEYSKERVQFDRPIASFQAVQHLIVDAHKALQASRWLIYQAAWRMDEGLTYDLEVSLAKVKANESYRTAARMAHQLHGGVGIYIESDLGIFSRRALPAQTILGDTNYHLDRIAQHLEALESFADR